ncbi:MAG: alanine racemase [bacterium]
MSLGTVPPSFNRAWAEIDLNALLWNFSKIRESISADCSVMAIVKANAYGHGAFMTARTLLEAGASCLGVARADEGAGLRKQGISAPIIVLTGVDYQEIDSVFQYNLIPALSRPDELKSLNQAAASAHRKLKVHLKLETGMNRLGIPEEERPDFFKALKRAPSLEVDGLFSHLSQTGPDGETENQRQRERFEFALKQFHDLTGINPAGSPWVHLANSSGIVMNRNYHFDLVRPGIMLYGLPPFYGCPVPLKPVLSWKAKIIQTRTVPPGSDIGYEQGYKTRRTTRVGVLPVGYADGYSRQLSNRAEVMVGGRLAPVIGNVCMDMTMIDLTDLPGSVDVGTAATLVGKEPGISAGRLAELSDTISYEIVSRIGPRIPRIFIRDGQVVSYE